MLGFSSLGSQALGALETPVDTGNSLTLGATEKPDTFACSITAETRLQLQATEAPDTFSGALGDVATITLAATEAPDSFAGSITTVTEEPGALGPDGWGPPRKVKERLRVDDRAELRALILKAKRGETAEAEAVVEAVAGFVETTQDNVVQIDWTALEHAQEQLGVVLQAIAVFQRHQQAMAADAAARALALAQFEQEEDELIALLLAA